MKPNVELKILWLINLHIYLPRNLYYPENIKKFCFIIISMQMD